MLSQRTLWVLSSGVISNFSALGRDAVEWSAALQDAAGTHSQLEPDTRAPLALGMLLVLSVL